MTDGNHDQFEGSKEEMLYAVDQLRYHLHSRASNARIIATLQRNPCLLRCAHDIREHGRSNDLDPLYLERHNYAKIKMIGAIRNRFGNQVVVGSEEESGVGKQDIVITPVLPKEDAMRPAKKISIELKSGKSVDLFQLERYLFSVNLLIVARVPALDVAFVSPAAVKEVLMRHMMLLTSSAREIVAASDQELRLLTVTGDWCANCSASCKHKILYGTGRRSVVPNLEDHERFMRDVDATVEKTLILLASCLSRQRVSDT